MGGRGTCDGNCELVAAVALATAVDNVIEGTPVLNATGPVAVEADDDWAEEIGRAHV